MMSEQCFCDGRGVLLRWTSSAIVMSEPRSVIWSSSKEESVVLGRSLLEPTTIGSTLPGSRLVASPAVEAGGRSCRFFSYDPLQGTLCPHGRR